MVSTRSATASFNSSSPEPTPSRTKQAKTPLKARTAVRDVASTGSPRLWSHTPSYLTILWLLISIPLCTWDSLYVILRPHSMPGGKFHWPLWVPYELYGRVDYVYGWKAWNERNGFTGAQTWMNVVEITMYTIYLLMVIRSGKQSAGQGRGAPSQQVAGRFGGSKVLYGQQAGLAALIGYSAAVMTMAKTALYWLNEYFSGFDNIGHNSVQSLIFLWIIPNGAWLVMSAYMAYVTGSEILQGLAIASGAGRQADNTKLLKAQ